MSKATRSILSVVVSLMLFSALTMAQTGRNNADKDKNKEHHSRFWKVAELCLAIGLKACSLFSALRSNRELYRLAIVFGNAYCSWIGTGYRSTAHAARPRDYLILAGGNLQREMTILVGAHGTRTRSIVRSLRIGMEANPRPDCRLVIFGDGTFQQASSGTNHDLEGPA